MRRLLVLIVLVLIFAALLALSRSRASWQHYVVSGDAGALLYAATFDGGAADGFNGEWDQYAGRLSTQIDGGQMQVSIGEAGSGAYSVAAALFRRFRPAGCGAGGRGSHRQWLRRRLSLAK